MIIEIIIAKKYYFTFQCMCMSIMTHWIGKAKKKYSNIKIKCNSVQITWIYIK